jgi:hypothetical protein
LTCNPHRSHTLASHRPPAGGETISLPHCEPEGASPRRGNPGQRSFIRRVGRLRSRGVLLTSASSAHHRLSRVRRNLCTHCDQRAPARGAAIPAALLLNRKLALPARNAPRLIGVTRSRACMRGS